MRSRQGFQPVERRIYGETESEVLAKASAIMGNPARSLLVITSRPVVDPTSGGVGAMGGLNDFDLSAFVEASCVRHGVPVKIIDVGVHRDVALLLSGRVVRGAAQRDVDRRAGSDAPDEIHPLRVEAATSDLVRGNHDVVEHGAHDGVLSGEVEFGPLSA